MIRKISLFLALFCFSIPVLAQAEEKADLVHVGIYVNQIYDVSLRDNRFMADFYVWFRWKNKELKPHETFEVAGGRIETRETIYQDVVEGFEYAVVRVTSTVTKYWDVSSFPLDNHHLTIEIEDSQSEDFKLAYIADAENSTINPETQVPGWQIGPVTNSVSVHQYKTNYGDISLPSGNASNYSRYVFGVDILRPGYGYFLKLFLSVFIATLISFLSFAIRPTDLDPRFGLGIGAIFAAVASQYVVTSALPDTNVITMADSLHILSVSYIFLALMESTISLKLCSIGKTHLSQKMDRFCLAFFTLTYISFNLIVIYDF